MKPATRALSALLLVAVVSGCNTTKSTDGQAKADEYVYVSETGSNIPRKVRKGQNSDGSLNIDKTDGRALEQMQRDQTLRTMRKDGS